MLSGSFHYVFLRVRLTKFQQPLCIKRSEQNELPPPHTHPKYCHRLLTVVSCQDGANSLGFAEHSVCQRQCVCCQAFWSEAMLFNSWDSCVFFSFPSVFPVLIIEYNEVEWWIIWFVLMASVTLVVFSALLVWAKWQTPRVRSEWCPVTSNHAGVFQT